MAEAPDAGHPPVLLLHGFLGTRGSMWLLERRLLDDGFTVVSYRLGPFNSGSIIKSAEKVARRVEALLESAGVEELDVVGHSMGGLIALHYVRSLGGAARVRRLVALGTPFSGTWVAGVGVVAMGLLSPGTWQLLPGHPLLKELREGPLPGNVRFYTIRGTRDWICPFAGTHLPGSQQIILPCDHAELVTSAEVYAAIRACLLDPESPAP
jgi:triacylglycerol lipase